MCVTLFQLFMFIKIMLTYAIIILLVSFLYFKCTQKKQRPLTLGEILLQNKQNYSLYQPSIINL